MDYTPSDDLLQQAFVAHTHPTGEMDINNFKRFCVDFRLLSKKFTIVDSELAFRKIIALVNARPLSDALQEGVIFGKRITFDVFKVDAVGVLSKEKNIHVIELRSIIEKEIEPAGS
jgi:hypothetical protein